jgi:fatty acid desaturase
MVRTAVMAAMDDVPREILQAAYRRKPLLNLKALIHYGLWAACGVAIWQTQDTPLGIAVGIASSLLITNLIRGLGAIGHDAAHGTVSKSKLVSYVVGLACWFPTGMSFTLYQNYHLHHHRIANTYPDVDNFVATDYTKNQTLARLLTFAIFTFAYPIYFAFQIARYIRRLTTAKKIRMHLELAAWFALMGACILYLPGRFFFFVYGLPFILSAMLASVAQMVEHYEMEPGEDAYSSRTYATSMPVMAFLWNNVSYHNEHHKFPGIPWYNLKWFHHTAFPHYDERVQREHCHPGFVGLAFRLWGRIFQYDVAKIDAKYASVDRDGERDKSITLPGIEVMT